jgi:hypothetical protein
VPSSEFATHTEPAPNAIPVGLLPTAICTTVPLAGSMRANPAPTAVADRDVGHEPIRILPHQRDRVRPRRAEAGAAAGHFNEQHYERRSEEERRADRDQNPAWATRSAERRGRSERGRAAGRASRSHARAPVACGRVLVEREHQPSRQLLRRRVVCERVTRTPERALRGARAQGRVDPLPRCSSQQRCSIRASLEAGGVQATQSKEDPE